MEKKPIKKLNLESIRVGSKKYLPSIPILLDTYSKTLTPRTSSHRQPRSFTEWKSEILSARQLTIHSLRDLDTEDDDKHLEAKKLNYEDIHDKEVDLTIQESDIHDRDIDRRLGDYLHDHLNSPHSKINSICPISDEDFPEWVQKQVEFWYGASYPFVQAKDWKSIEDMLVMVPIGKNVIDYLDMNDLDIDKVNLKYNDFGKEKVKHTSHVLLEMIKSESLGHFTSEHRFPILMVNSIGPWTPLIGYNREPGSHTILWPMDYLMHKSISTMNDNIQFQDKKSVVLFRDCLEEPLENTMIDGKLKVSRLTFLDEWKKKEHPWLDIGITSVWKGVKDNPLYAKNKKDIDTIWGKHMNMKQMLNHKYILCLEGVDVSHNLGWALLSNCVPLCPNPFVFEVWYHCGLLPWVHYVPLADDVSDLQSVYEWCESHPVECDAISKAGRLHMMTMLHPKCIHAVKEAVSNIWDFKGLPETSKSSGDVGRPGGSTGSGGTNTNTDLGNGTGSSSGSAAVGTGNNGSGNSGGAGIGIGIQAGAGTGSTTIGTDASNLAGSLTSGLGAKVKL